MFSPISTFSLAANKIVYTPIQIKIEKDSFN